MNADPLIKDRVFRSARPAALPLVSRPTPSFNFVVDVAAGRYAFLVQTLNALMLALPLAFVAFVEFAVAAGIPKKAQLEEYRARQHSRNPEARLTKCILFICRRTQMKRT